MSTRDSDRFLQPYRVALDRHGAGFDATLWGSRAAQQLRFAVMADLVDFEGSSLVDIGCGPGDFAAFLVQREIGFTRFVGLDAFEEVIAHARERGLPRSTFAVRDVLHDALGLDEGPGLAPDYCCLSGTLNTMSDEAARGLVERAFEASAQGVVFNFLSDRAHARWAGRDLTPARRFDTVQWLDWALSRSSRVAFTQDYLDGHDATIVIRHD